MHAEAALHFTSIWPRRMTRQEIAAIVEHFPSLAAEIHRADPGDKAEIYKGINLVLTHQPDRRLVRAEAHVSADSHGVMVSVRGGT